MVLAHKPNSTRGSRFDPRLLHNRAYFFGSFDSDGLVGEINARYSIVMGLVSRTGLSGLEMHVYWMGIWYLEELIL